MIGPIFFDVVPILSLAFGIRLQALSFLGPVLWRITD